MKKLSLLFVLMLAVVLGAQAQTKPRIVIIATGGTIAGAAETSTSGGYTAGVATVDQLIAAVPQIKDLADIKGIQISNIGSQEMNDNVWLALAKEINKVFAAGNCDGIVITHGTDTMEETSYFLNLTVKSDKPVVLVGSMRPSTALSADGPLNLFKAVALASNPQAVGKGVMVLMNDYILGADDITKTNTTNVDAFKCPNYGPMGVMYESTPFFSRNQIRRHTTQSEFDVTNLTKLPVVDILYGYANASPLPAEALVKAKVDGIVHAGVGNGNIYPAVMDVLDKGVKQGIQVVRSSRIQTGMVPRNGEVNDDEHGYVASYFLGSPKSRVLLMLALTKTKDTKEIQRMFMEY